MIAPYRFRIFFIRHHSHISHFIVPVDDKGNIIAELAIPFYHSKHPA